MLISDGKVSAVKVNFRVAVMNVQFPNCCTRMASRTQLPPGHFSTADLVEIGTVLGDQHGDMTIVRGCFWAEKVSTQSG
jgi:hypothetical protein